MKKLFLSLAVVMSVSLFSCGNGSTENADSTAVEGDTTVAEAPVAEVAEVAEDTTATDTTVVAEVAEVAVAE